MKRHLVNASLALSLVLPSAAWSAARGPGRISVGHRAPAVSGPVRTRPLPDEVSQGSNSFGVGVTNNLGEGAGVYVACAGYSGIVTSCSVSGGTGWLEPGQSTVFTVTFNVSGGGDGEVDYETSITGTCYLEGYCDGSDDTTPDYVHSTVIRGTSLAAYSGTPNMLRNAPMGAGFLLTNTGNGPDQYSFTCSVQGTLTSCDAPANQSLGGGAGTWVSATMHSGGTGGAGAVTLTATSLGDGSKTATATDNVTVLSEQPSVAASPASYLVSANSSGNSATFVVQNVGNYAGTFNYTCGGVPSCTHPAQDNLAAGQSVTRTVTYTAGSDQSLVTLTATEFLQGETASASATVVIKTYAVALSPHTGTATTASSTNTTTSFTITNNGNVDDTYYLECGRAGQVANCWFPGAGWWTNISVPAGGSVNTAMWYTTADFSGSGSTWLTANSTTKTSARDRDSIVVIVPAAYAVGVSPSNGGALSAWVGSNGNGASFTIANNGNISDNYTLTCTAGGKVASCANSSVTVGGHSSSTVAMTYTAAGTTGSGTVQVTATGTGGVTSNASYTVNVNSSRPTLVSVEGTIFPDPNTWNQAHFTLQNVGNTAADYTVQVTLSGSFVDDYNPVANVSASAGAYASVNVPYHVGAGSGSGSVNVTVRSTNSTVESASSSATITRPIYAVSVTALDPSETVSAFTTGHTARFRVTNTSNLPMNFGTWCTPTGSLTVSSCPGLSGALAVNASQDVTVSYDDAAPVASTLSYSAAVPAAGVSGGAATTVTIPVVRAAGVAAVAGAGTVIGGTPGHAGSFTVANNGNVTDTLDVTCTGTTPISCDLSHATPVILAHNTSMTFGVQVYSGDRITGGTGYGVLRAVSHSFSNVSAKDSVSVFDETHYVQVTTAGTAIIEVGVNTTQVFAVNNQGNVADTYTLTYGCTHVAISCGDGGTSQITVPARGTSNFSVAYSTGGTSSNSADQVSVSATNTLTNHAAHVTVSVTGIPSPTLTTTQGPLTLKYLTWDTIPFTVHNNSQWHAQTYNITCTGPSRVLASCTPPATIASLGPQVSQTFNVPMQSKYVGANFSFTVTATPTDGSGPGAATVPLTVTGDYAAPLVTLHNQNGRVSDRGDCLVTGAGEASWLACGDLMVAHAMPAYRTMGRDRSLTLIYNSATAAVRPTVAAWVTLLNTEYAPDSLRSELWLQTSVGGAWTKQAGATYNFWGYDVGTKQIALSFSTTLSSGIYPFRILTTHLYASSSPADTTGGELLIVNRQGSIYGAGWGMAGEERLLFGADIAQHNRLLHVEGDGSAAVYDSVGAGVWLRAPSAFRDSIVRTGSGYTRKLRHGVLVKFNQAGFHSETDSRTGQVTSFNRDGGNVLTSITVPPAGQPYTTYLFGYTSGKLTSVMDPAGRILGVTDSAGLITRFTDADNVATNFAYDGSGFLTRRVNRRGYGTAYSYGNTHVTRIAIPFGNGASDTSVTAVTSWDHLGDQLNVVTGFKDAVDTTNVFTSVDGPRTDVVDVAKFWVNGLGAPVKIVDPLGNATVISYDAASPSLAARAQYANGRVIGMGYNGRANLSYVADSTHEGGGSVQVATTSYLYNDGHDGDSPSQVTTPVDTTRFVYDTLGLTQLVTAQNGHKTAFTYFASGALKGLVTAVTDSAVPVVDTTAWTKANQDLTTSFTYTAWGNDSTQVSPKGSVTAYGYDEYQRVMRTQDPVGHHNEYVYDVLNRTITSIQYDDATSNSPLMTQYYHSLTGEADSVIDPRGVRRGWTYDAAGRAVTMIDEAGATEHRHFNPAGQLDTLTTRSGDVVTFKFDESGQLRRTKYPARSSHGQSVAGDSIVRTYDAVGKLLTATNQTGVVTSTYNREGTMASERQQAESGAVDLTLRYTYDLGDRRTRAIVGSDTIRYGYGPAGTLDSMMVRWVGTSFAPDTFRYHWDALGRRDSLIYSSGTRVGYSYDKDGALRLLCSVHTGTTFDGLFDESLEYTNLAADGNVLGSKRWVKTGGTCGNAGSLVESFTATYDGRHQMVTQQDMHHSSPVQFHYDSSGNIANTVDGLATTTSVHNAHRNRLSSQLNNGFSIGVNLYDANGSRYTDSSSAVLGGLRYYHYNALGQMVGMGNWYLPSGGGQATWINSVTACGYDALGRRVASCGDTQVGFLGFDGDNTVRGSGPEWRWVHGPALDDPLVAVTNDGGTWRRFYFLTDGRGRELAYATPSGDSVFAQAQLAGDAPAGAITRSNTFANGRAEGSQLPRVSFYRNRYYDQATGRWTQEDPLGIAGGINLYNYAENNPRRYTDPFGLTVTCTYEQKTGKLVCTDDTTHKQVVNVTGYSGNGVGKNNPAKESVANVGPLPKGGYSIVAPGHNGTAGPMTLTLNPGAATDMHGRFGMAIHGDSRDHPGEASKGCIVVGYGVRKTISDAGGGTLTVVPGN